MHGRAYSLLLMLIANAWSCVTSKPDYEPRMVKTPEAYGAVSYAHCFVQDDKILLLGGYRANEEFSMFNSSGLTFSETNNVWQPWPTAKGPVPKNNFAAVQGTEGIYMFGGKAAGQSETRDFYLFHSDKNLWETIPASDRLKPRVNSSLTAVDNRIVVFGGKNAEHKNNWGVYDEFSKTWKVYSSYTKERSSHIAVRYGSKVLVWGGFEDQKRVKDGMILDPTNGDAKPLPMMPFLEPRANAKAVSDGEKVWIIGGVSDKGSKTDGAFYDGAYESWQYIPPLPEPDRKDFEIAWIPDEGILLWGGRNTKGLPVDKSYILNDVKRTWSEVKLPLQPTPRIAHCLGTIQDELYIFGGLTAVPGQGQSLSPELWFMPLKSLKITDIH